MRIAATGDLHARLGSAMTIRDMLHGIDTEADVLVLAGDLTDMGHPAEMEILLGELDRLALPKVAVLGNHDYNNGQSETLAEMMEREGVHVLEGTTWQIGDIGFVGSKGFCGGFHQLFVDPFGERGMRDFIQGSIDAAARIERALSALDTPRKVVVLHYSPVRDTLLGEDEEIFAFLGSYRLAIPLDHFQVDMAMHGHSHRGAPLGHTPGNIPVYNVSAHVQSRFGPRPYCLLEI